MTPAAPRVVGIDLSLTSTGLADSTGHTMRIRTKPTKGADQLLDNLARFHDIRSHILNWACFADLTVIEGPSYGSTGGQAHTRAGLWWAIAEALIDQHHRLLVVPPSTLKTYATGKGNASKDDVLIAIVKRYPTFEVDGNDVADATALAAIGARLLEHPIDELPKTHTRALTKVNWLAHP